MIVTWKRSRAWMVAFAVTGALLLVSRLPGSMGVRAQSTAGFDSSTVSSSAGAVDNAIANGSDPALAANNAVDNSGGGLSNLAASGAGVVTAVLDNGGNAGLLSSVVQGAFSATAATSPDSAAAVLQGMLAADPKDAATIIAAAVRSRPSLACDLYTAAVSSLGQAAAFAVITQAGGNPSACFGAPATS